MKTLPSPRLFYGWVIVGVVFLIGLVSMGMGTINFGLFIKPMELSLGITRANFGWAQTARLTAGALMGPVMGRILDRYGPRVLFTIAGIITVACLVALRYTPSWWYLIVVFAIAGATGITGPQSLFFSVPIAKWFVRQRGRAMAFTSVGLPVGGILFLPVTQVLISSVGWRTTWLVLAFIGVCTIVPLSAVFLRRQPEDMGLLPDGAPELNDSSSGSTAGAPTSKEVAWTLSDALRTTTFWRLVLVFSLISVGFGSIALHRVPHFIDLGFDPQVVSFAVAMDPGAAVLTTVAAGFFLDRLPPRVVGAIACLGWASGAALIILSDTHVLMFSGNALFGLAAGVMLVLQGFMWAQYFGRAFQGAIRGVVFPVTLFASGLASPIAGYVNDTTGSYAPVWWVAVGGVAVAAVVLFLTPPPRHRTAVVQITPAANSEREGLRG